MKSKGKVHPKKDLPEPEPAIFDFESSGGESDFSDDNDPNASAAQWVDEDELDQFEEEVPHVRISRGHRDMRAIEEDLSTLPFGALAKASQALDEEEGTDSEDHSDEDEGATPMQGSSRAHDQEPSTFKGKPKKVKRHDKHAPMEVTSKKPVTRRRTVVDVPKIERRDPRFSALSGDFKPEAYSHSYSFITSIQENEVDSLRQSLNLARKLSQSSPAHLREERAAEVTRLERALKRTESAVDRSKREKRSREALARAKREEREKQEKGKGGWYMKESEKRQLVAKARFEDLAASGGKQAVKKAIEKRKLKLSQKEKRERPDGKPTAKRQRID